MGRQGLLARVRPEVHGHRGARWLYPENTLPGFEYAIDAGADFIELDVVVTADDVPVVWHDAVLRRRKCLGPRSRAILRSLTLDQLRAWDCGQPQSRRFPEQRSIPGLAIPTLDEVLALAPRGRFQFNIEIKTFPSRPRYSPPAREHVELVLDAIRRQHLEPRVRLQSFDTEALAAVHELAPEIPTALLYSGMPPRFSTVAARAQVPIVGPFFRLVTRRRVEEAHDSGIRVVTWTPNRPRQWLRLIRAGVDGIITDNPAGLIATMREWGLR